MHSKQILNYFELSESILWTAFSHAIDMYTTEAPTIIGNLSQHPPQLLQTPQLISTCLLHDSEASIPALQLLAY